MDRLQIQRKLYDARNEYLKAKSQMEFYKREIEFLKNCERSLNSDLFTELFGELK